MIDFWKKFKKNIRINKKSDFISFLENELFFIEYNLKNILNLINLNCKIF
jgi:hypothetical protein